MYNIEFFDENVNYVDNCFVSDSQTLDVDYLAMNAFNLQFPKNIDIKKGYLCRIWHNMEILMEGVISEYQPEDDTSSIGIRPLLAILDFNVWNTEIQDSGTWIKAQVEDFLINTSDVLQRRPIQIASHTSETPMIFDDDYDDVTKNVMNVAIEALRRYNVVTNCRLDPSSKQIIIDIYQNNVAVVIESDLKNVIRKSITLGDSYGSYNKYVIQRIMYDSETEDKIVLDSQSYYLHTDGTVSDVDEKRITPVFWGLDELEDSETWDVDALTMAIEFLTPEQYDNNIELEYRLDDSLGIQNLPFGSIATIYIHGSGYKSVLTGKRYANDTVVLIFGTVRIELTKQLVMEGR